MRQSLKRNGAPDFIPGRNVAWHSHGNPDCSISDGNYAGIQDKNIAARTHDGNYANYMQILGDTLVDRYKR